MNDLFQKQSEDRLHRYNIENPDIYIYDPIDLLVNRKILNNNILREKSYLTNIPQSANNYGISKVLAVRHEIIHIKHVFTEVFVRKSIDIQKYLDTLKISLFHYIEIMTNRMRKVHNFSRRYTVHCPDHIVKSDRYRFFPNIELVNGLNVTIVLDFDGVVTDNKFNKLYNKCIEVGKVQICSANPTITEEWFKKRGLPKPFKINSMKGKIAKIKRLIEIQKKYDYVFFVDNEIKYLEYAWLFGLQTYHWDGKQIKQFTLNTK